MPMACADCGCLVDHGAVVAPCRRPRCCCLDLPRGQAAEPPPGGSAGQPVARPGMPRQRLPRGSVSPFITSESASRDTPSPSSES
jgi:hypothetical protein